MPVKPFNLGESERARLAELRRLENCIRDHAETLIEPEVEDAGSVIRELAEASYKWTAVTRQGGELLLCRFGPEFLRIYSTSLRERAQQARSALDELNEVLNPPPRYPEMNPEGEGTSLDEFIRDAVNARGISAQQFNEAFSALDEAITAAEEEGGKLYGDWVKKYGGNKPPALHYLRIELDDCLSNEIRPRKRRARIIAAVEAAIGIVSAEQTGSEAGRIKSFLQYHGR